MKKLMAILIGFLLAHLLAACSSATATPAPTSAPTAVPSTVAQVIPEFSTGDLDQGGEEQAAGQYQTPAWFDVPFQFATAMSYRGGGQSSDRGQIFALERGQNAIGNATHRLVFFAFPSDVSSEEPTAQLRAMPLFDSSEIRDITLLNVTGTQWDAVARPNPGQRGESGVADGTIAIPALFELMRFDGVWHTATPEVRLRFMVPDVTGHTMLIYVEAPPAEFDAWASEVEQLLKTVTFVARAEVEVVPTVSSNPDAPPGEVWGPPGGALAIDAQDNVYVLPFEDNMTIYKYDPNGKLLTQWGGPGSGEGQFNYRVGSYWGMDLAVDAQGNVYVADFGNFRIQKFDSNGKFLKQWGSQGKEPGQFFRAWAIAVDSAGNVYVGDEGNSRIQKFDRDGNLLIHWGGSGIKEDEFQSIVAVEVDHADNVYAGDYFLRQVKKFDSSGNLLTTWNSCGAGVDEPIRPISFAVDDRNNVYVLDSFNQRVCIYDANGKLLESWGRIGKGIGEFDFYENDAYIAIDSRGNLYVADGATSGVSANNRIQKFRLNK